MRAILIKTKELGPKVLRVLAFAVAVYLVAMAFAAHKVKAETEEILLGIGSEMMRYPGADRESRDRQMVLNGARIALRTGSTQASLEEVLEYFEAQCQTRDGRFAEQLEAIEGVEEFDVDPNQIDGTLSMNVGDRGFVACLDMGEEQINPASIGERVERFLGTGDLSEVGYLRYLFAETSDRGGTFFMTMFTDETLNLYEMFPTNGDVPGHDALPRPEGSRRILSSHETNQPYSASTYTREGLHGDDFVAHYESTFEGDGWLPAEVHEGEQVEVAGGRALVFEQRDRLAFVHVLESAGVTSAMVIFSDAP